MWDKKSKFNSKITLGFSTLFLMGMLVGFQACKRQVDQNISNQVPAVKPAPTPIQIVEKEKTPYIYQGDKFRDPFAPSGFVVVSKTESMFDPQNTKLRGIIFSNAFKTAIITTTGGGSYFIKNGRIFDVMSKPIIGFSAKVMVDRIIILDDADNKYEIKIKDELKKNKSEGKSL